MSRNAPALPFVSIIVLIWNGQRFIDGFFRSVNKQTYPHDRFEVLFVDNSSTDNSVSYFLSQKIPYARLVETGKNYGYGGGNNFGFKAAKGDFIAICNSDLELAPDWLEKMVHRATVSKAAVVVPKVLFGDGKTINNAGSMLYAEKDWPIIERGIDQSANDPAFSKVVAVTAFCGANPFFRRSFLEDVGLFDKDFFMYWEDGDLSWRGQKAGKQYVYEPDAVSYHQHAASSGGEQSRTFVYCVSRNRVLILLKHARLAVAFRALAKVGRDHVLWKMRDVSYAFRHASGRRQSISNLWLGISIVWGIIYLSPVMLAKRWHIIKEETL